MLGQESLAADARADNCAGAASEPTRIAATASAAKIVDSTARTVKVPILTTRGVTVLMIGSSSLFPLSSLQCLSGDLSAISGTSDVRFRDVK